MKRLLIAAVLGLALPAQAMAAPSWQDLSEQTALRVIDTAPLVTSGVTIRAFPVNVHPAAAAPSFFTNFVAAGIAQNGVPCFNCVSGVPSALGIPDPFNYVSPSTTMQYNVAWTNLSFVGTCTVSIAITSGKTVIDKASFKVPGISGTGGYDIGFDRGRPTYSGNAIITGKVKCGKPASSANANLIFQ